MDQSKDQLIETLLQLAGSLTEEDLLEPETYALASQLVQILEPKPDPLPQELIDQLQTIRDKATRFKMAASATGAVQPELMERLVASMKAAGLWKSEDSEGPKMLVHYSKHPEQLTHIDPTFHGSGTRGAERRRDNRIPRSYYYDEGTAPEKLVTSGAKFQYKVKHPDNVMDIAHSGSRSIIDSARLPSGHLDATDMEQKIKDAGFAGYRNSKSALPNVVALFHPAEVHEATKMHDLQKSEADHLNDMLEKSVSKKDFTNSHILLHPVSIGGHTQDPHDSNIPPYHVTVKQFGDHEPGTHPDFFPHGIQASVDRHQASAPKSIKVKAHKFENKVTGDTHHVLLLDGAHPELHNVHKDVAHYAPDWHAFLPHISVSKEIHDKVLHGGHTSESLDIKVHPLEYRVGNEPKHTFSPAPVANPDYDIHRLKKNETAMTKHEDLIKKTKEVIESLRKSERNKEADLLQEVLEKSKNRKEQQKEVFGGWKTSPKSDRREKQMGALETAGKKRYGLDTEKAPGKPNASGKIIDKPTFDNPGNKIQHIGNPDSLVHEHGHLEVAPEGKGLKPYQHGMDKEWGRQNVAYGYKQQARAVDEYGTTALENPLRRRAGLPAHQKHTTEKNPKRDFAVDAPDKKITKEVNGKKLTGTSENRPPEMNRRMDQVDRGELKFHPDHGWKPGTSPDSKVNQKARATAEDPSKAGRKDAKTLMRSEDAKPKSLKQQREDEKSAQSESDSMKESAADFHNKLANGRADENMMPGMSYNKAKPKADK